MTLLSFSLLVALLAAEAALRLSGALIARHSARFGFTSLADVASLPLILLLVTAVSLVTDPLTPGTLYTISNGAPYKKLGTDPWTIKNSGLPANGGGSFLAIPKQSKHPKEAYDLAAYLTAPEQELAVFKEIGNLPSLPSLYTDPALTSFSNPFFSDAPVGTIFSDTAAQLKPQYLGTKNGPVRQAVENVVREVEAGSISADDGWNKASKEAEKAAE